MPGHASPQVQILDIRRDKVGRSLRDDVLHGLNPTDGSPKTLPSLLLYDEKGLRLFEEITYLDEYYLTNAEIDALQSHAADIAAIIPSGTRVIELGSGNLRKVNILLDACEKQSKDVEYYALDVSLEELQRTFALIDTHAYKHVSFHGLHGTYDDGLEWIRRDAKKGVTTCLMSLGSSIGNFTPDEATDFLASFAQVLNPADLILVGLDACQDANRVFKAYNDSQHTTEQFYRNGLVHANQLLGEQVFDQCNWNIEGAYDKTLHKHHASYVARKSLGTKGFNIQAGEKIHFEESHKYAAQESDHLWHSAGLIHQMAFANNDDDYHLHLLSPATYQVSDKAAEYAKSPVPSVSDWETIWTLWDVVTRAMVPRDELLEKPIKLRNNLIFYLGHIPAFADIHYSKATLEKPTDPAYYHTIFERGIDPDVDNPQNCHAHSELPENWPPLNEMLGYQMKVRARILSSYQSGAAVANRRLARGLWLAYEHEAMHLETFLYMLIQSSRVLPPPGVNAPDFKAQHSVAAAKRVPNMWHHVPESKIVIGLDDPENDDGPDRFFGWDNERPSRSVTVPAFEAQSRPISNGEYSHFLETTKTPSTPASWTRDGANGPLHLNGTKKNGAAADHLSSNLLEGLFIKTVYGPIPLKYVLDWPVMASFDELAAYAAWANGRIPTFEEVKSIYSYVENSKSDLEKVSSTLISAVNGHLSNEGVEETPPSNGTLSDGGAKSTSPDPKDLFIDLDSRNLGFKNWHPTPVTDKEKLCGQSDTGGLWEWTSTSLASFEGFKPMDLYPGYTADFFDDKHNICLGGSWATVPRIGGRKSFLNWYQRNYPYVWCTARLVRDIA